MQADPEEIICEQESDKNNFNMEVSKASVSACLFFFFFFFLFSPESILNLEHSSSFQISIKLKDALFSRAHITLLGKPGRRTHNVFNYRAISSC